MFKVYNISWAGLKMHVETFNTYKEAKKFVDDHKNYCLVIQ